MELSRWRDEFTHTHMKLKDLEDVIAMASIQPTQYDTEHMPSYIAQRERLLQLLQLYAKQIRKAVGL